MTSPSGQAPAADLPQRVSTLELFFDLVFVFTITQLTSYLARDVTLAAAGRVLLVFGLLWWMYGGYAWLTNARTPSRPPERLLLLLGMAGFLVIGLPLVRRWRSRRGQLPSRSARARGLRCSRPWWRARSLWRGALGTIPLKHDRQVHAAGDGPGLV